MADGVINLLLDVATQTTLALVQTAVDAINAKIPASPATAGAQATGNASLASLDGKVTACNTGAVTVTVCALPSGASTAAAQATAQASLTSIDGKIVACNTGAVTVTTCALPAGAATEATLSTLNGKVTACNTGAVVVASSALPSGAATEAKQDTGNTSAATTATNTGTTATNTTTLAGAVLASDTTITGGIEQVGGVGSATAPTSVTDGRSVRAWFTRFGAAMVGLLGANGTAIASASNGVPVVAQTSSTWDVGDRLTRALGFLTGINGTTAATGANPVPVQLSDGSAVFTGAKTGQLPAGLGTLVSSGSVSVVRSVASIDKQTTLATAGKVIKASAGICYGLTSYFNNTGGAIFFQVFNSTSTPTAGDRPDYFSASIASGTKSSLGFGITALGIGCPTGITFAVSSTQDTFTAIASTAVIYALQYD